ncbi:brother of CDO-like [Biomphalaria glabrata]|uniref:Brother of CDO-like n=1 Tax=Biomphalaria glabrata TaxID=6526 RepID=A0A9W2ZBG2_BIOGL|nr:brother of CDO-like [Biomphalaria glabrata]
MVMILRKFLLLYCFGHCLADEALRPPDIHTPNSSKTIFKSLNQRFSVVCNATGLPSPRVEWRKGEIEGNNTITGNISFDPYTGVLTFERFSENEEGEYRCFSTNYFKAPEGRTFAVSISPPLTFRVMRLEEIETGLETMPLNGIEYQYMKLPCTNVKVMAESVIYNWYKGKEPMPMILDDRMYIDKDDKPIFRENQGPKDATVIEGKDVEMHCLARSLTDEVSPSPPVWRINGKSILIHT